MFAKDSRRGHANEHMRTSLANSGRIAGMGIAYDDYSEDSFPGRRKTTGAPAFKPRTKEETDFMVNGGEVKTYKLSKAELEKMGYKQVKERDKK